MTMYNKTEAMDLWKHEMGDKEYAYDFTGKKIKKSDYLETNQVGWVITNLKPLRLGGTNNIGNTIICHHRSFEEWKEAYPKFKIDEVEYMIHYNAKDDYYYIEQITDDEDDSDEETII